MSRRLLRLREGDTKAAWCGRERDGSQGRARWLLRLIADEEDGGCEQVVDGRDLITYAKAGQETDVSNTWGQTLGATFTVHSSLLNLGIDPGQCNPTCIEARRQATGLTDLLKFRPTSPVILHRVYLDVAGIFRVI